MKIVILGDTHFGGGYSFGKVDTNTHLNSRLIDFSNTFDYVIDYMINNNVFHFILTGDIFEHRRPQASELSLFSKKICRLTELGIHTYIVIGNHDLIREQKTTTLDVLGSLKLPLVHIYPDIDSAICASYNSSDKINTIFLPYRTREMIDCNSNEEAIKRFTERLQYEIGKLEKNPTIVIGHLMLKGTMIGNAVLEASPGEVVLPLEMFKSVNAVIMGHVHPLMIVKKKPFITYIGSMECKDFGEAKHEKYFLVVENNDKKLSYTFEKLLTRKMYDLEIDQSFAENSKDVIEKSLLYIENFSKENNLDGSIIRVNIATNEKCLYDLNKDLIKQELKQKYKINFCIGIYPQITSKRQLRKSTINEHGNPITSFNQYLELETDADMRERMRKIGTMIIKDRVK